MNSVRIAGLLRGDVLRASRSAVVLWLVVMPFAMTFLLKIVFPSILESRPMLCVLDQDSSGITGILADRSGIRVQTVSDLEGLLSAMRYNEADAGLVLAPEFDSVLKAGGRPLLDISVSEGSDPLDRAVILLTLLDASRELQGTESPFDAVLITEDTGDGGFPLQQRLVPAVVLVIMMISGIFLPAYLFVRERERRTLRAVMVTPAKMSEVLLSKTILGFCLTLVICSATLVLNGTDPSLYPPLLVILIVGTIVCNSIGLLYGLLAGNVKTLYTMVKSLNVFLAGPMAFYLISGIPRWVVMIFPTYWFIDPLYTVSLGNAGFTHISWKLFVGLLVGVALLLPVRILADRMRNQGYS
jgi:ABC-2 type transport system permease protein